MGYLIAAYTVTAVVLIGYGLALVRERARQRARGQPNDGTTSDCG